MRKKILFLPILLFTWLPTLLAQTGSDDFMRANGKINVVVAVIVAVFVGLIIFLLYLDRRLTKIENQINEHE